MKTESEERLDEADAGFRMQVFANDPRLYHELFEKEDEMSEVDMEDIAPQTPEELERVLNQIQRYGGFER